MWRKLILGKGAAAEQESGISGNSILLAQARPDHLAASLPPLAEQLQDTFVVLFARSIDDVSKAKMLVVNRKHYIELVRTRQRVCAAYADIPLDEERACLLPENDVPKEIIACAQHLPETENVNITKVGPASRPVDVPCDHNADAEQNGDDNDWEDLDGAAVDPAKPTRSEIEHQAFDTNTAEDVIAVDHSNQPGTLETFAACTRAIAESNRRPTVLSMLLLILVD